MSDLTRIIDEMNIETLMEISATQKRTIATLQEHVEILKNRITTRDELIEEQEKLLSLSEEANELRAGIIDALESQIKEYERIFKEQGWQITTKQSSLELKH